METCAEEMQAANDVGNTRSLYKIVKKLSGKVDTEPEVDLNKDAQGNVISNATERAAALKAFFCSSMFSGSI